MRVISSCILLFLIGCTTNIENDIQRTQVAQNLDYFIGAVSEGPEGLSKASQVSDCVDKEASLNWDSEKYQLLNSELELYIPKLLEASRNIEFVLTNGLPEPTDTFVDLKGQLVNYVLKCEKEIGTSVEF